MFVSFNGRRKEIYAGIWILPDQWDHKNATIRKKTPGSQDMLQHLELMRSKLMDSYFQLLKEGTPILEDIIEMANGHKVTNHSITLLISRHYKHLVDNLGIRYQKATLTKYRALKSKVEDFLKEKLNKDDLLLKNMTLDFADQFYLFLRKDHNTEQNTASKYIRCLKTVINYGIKMGWVKENPIAAYRCTFKETPQVILTPNELEAIIKKDFHIVRIKRVKNLFVFLCYTGVAYADLFRLKCEHVITGVEGKYWLSFSRKKTDNPVQILLLPPAIEVLNKLNPEWKSGNDKPLLPVVSSQILNGYLKEIADACGIKKDITTHVGRRTFATSVLLYNNVPLETVSKLLGHKNVRTTQVYAKVLQQKVLNDLEKLDGDLTKKEKE
jgi:site-specific recombinase XerD